MLLLQLRATTAQEICDSIVAMGEMLLSCYLYNEIMVCQHQTVLAVMSNTRCTQGYHMFPKISTSHKSQEYRVMITFTDVFMKKDDIREMPVMIING